MRPSSRILPEAAAVDGERAERDAGVAGLNELGDAQAEEHACHLALEHAAGGARLDVVLAVPEQGDEHGVEAGEARGEEVEAAGDVHAAMDHVHDEHQAEAVMRHVAHVRGHLALLVGVVRLAGGEVGEKADRKADDDSNGHALVLARGVAAVRVVMLVVVIVALGLVDGVAESSLS